MNSELAFTLALFKKHWSEMAGRYQTNNNDAALMFRAIIDLVIASREQNIPSASSDKSIEQVVAHFPDHLAPLCRSLAQVCLEAWQHHRPE